MSPLIVCTICLLMKVAFIKSAMMHGSPYRDFRASLVEEMNDLASKVGSLRTVNGISELQCTAECANTRNCFSFVYNIKSGVCKMHQTRLTHSSDQVHRQDGSRYYLLQANDVSSQSLDCRWFPTYSLNTEFSVCYRVGTKAAQRAAAMTDCRNDHPSAHMITLLSISMMDFFNSAVGGDFWIDGDYQFQTWDNGTMPWERWTGSVRPSMSVGDAIIIHKGGRVMKKEGETGSVKYVCEID